MRATLSILFILGISYVLPQVGDRRHKEIRYVSKADDHGDAGKSIQEYVEEAGFKFEEHETTTTDGYVLSLWSIFKVPQSGQRKGPPVIMLHGLLEDGYSFILSEPSKNLPMYLARKGYDVWLANNRGQTYSLEHTGHLSSTNPFSPFWNFTFHEMSLYDFPAIVDYVKRRTGYEKVFIQGHSQGATTFFVKGMFDSEYVNRNVQAFVATGPALFLYTTKSEVASLLASLKLFEVMYAIGLNYFWVFSARTLTIFEPLCRLLPNLYHILVPYIAGHPTKTKFDLRRWPSLCTKLPGGSSAKNMVHWMQLMRSGGKFLMFDYGSEGNSIAYNQSAPPEYPIDRLKDIHVPILALYGTRDTLVPRRSVLKLAQFFSPESFEIMVLDDYAHMDYTWSTEAITNVYPNIERFFRRHRMSAPQPV